MPITCPNCHHTFETEQDERAAARARLTLPLPNQNGLRSHQQPSERTIEIAMQLTRYLDERTIRGKHLRVPIKALQDDLQDWWYRQGSDFGLIPYRQTLGRALVLNGLQRHEVNSTQYYLGVELRA